MQQSVRHNRGLPIEENARRWSEFRIHKNCPVCGCDRVNARKLMERINQPSHWRWTCSNGECKAQWYKPFEHLNTVEQ